MEKTNHKMYSYNPLLPHFTEMSITGNMKEFSFELTKEELESVVNEITANMLSDVVKCQFMNPEVSGEGLKEGDTVIFNKGMPTALVTINISLCSGRAIIGKKIYDNEFVLTEPIAKMLYKKYGEQFNILFAWARTSYYKARHNYDMSLEECCDALNRDLSCIGKYSEKPHILVIHGRNGYSYEELKDISQDENV